MWVVEYGGDLIHMVGLIFVLFVFLLILYTIFEPKHMINK